MSETFDWDSIEEKVKKTESKQKSFNDDRFWKLAHNKEKGTSSSVLRFLPQPGIFEDKDLENYVEIHKHSIFLGKKGAFTGIYTENDPEYLHAASNKDVVRKISPLMDLQRTLFFKVGEFVQNQDIKAYSPKAIAAREESKIFRSKRKFITNMKVVFESENSDNKDLHFLYEFGPQVMNFIDSKTNLTKEMKEQMEQLGEEQQKLYNPMDKGWNIKIITKKGDKGFAYDLDVQKQCKAFDTSEDAVEFIKNECVDLSEFTSADNFKTYEELKVEAVKLLKNYRPKYMDEVDFRKVVISLFGNIYEDGMEDTQEAKKEEEPSTSGVDTKDEDTQEAKKEEEPSTSGVVIKDEADEELDDFFKSL